jgi:general stress protein 26
MAPTTGQLDHRFSDPDAKPVPWDDARRVLEDAQLSWLTTVRADGRPHATPLVAVWLDEAVHFCTGPDEQKSHNLATNRNVVLTTGCNRWDEGIDVIVEGEAGRVTDRETLERLARAWRTKWDGQWTYGVTDGGFSHDGDPGGADGQGGPRRIFLTRRFTRRRQPIWRRRRRRSQEVHT